MAKRIPLFILCGILLLCITACGQKTDYTAKLVSVLREKETATVREIFAFEFNRAYVFNDCYLSGSGLAEKYDLDISIHEVESGVTEEIQRIVFVDDAGSFVYEFRCRMSDAVFPTEGIILYPETQIERTSSAQNEPIKLRFLSTEHYDSVDFEM